MKETAPLASATERVGRYQLLEPIGIGTNGAVSRAKVFGVAGFERQFAVKRFHAEVTATSAMAAALSAGARSYGGLEHPRIARMSEFGVAQGTTFTAVELVTGLDIMRLLAEAKLANTTLAVGGSLALVSQAARAVGYAHGRGLAHLGLAPTNVIVTPEGDVKVTDFGILAATLPARPIDVPRLANRIAYLAPEQLTGEATSAATDVFALGVIAYELVTGQRTFRGDTATQIAQAILAGPPPEPALPRPIVRVLQRCVARSPFERFPDARALADALDAALRVAPVPGTRKDIGAQVKDTLDRLSSLNEGAMSGVVALHVGTGPVRRLEPLEVEETNPVTSVAPDDDDDDLYPLPEPAPRPSQDGLDPATSEFVRPDLPVAGPAPMVGPARTGDAGVTLPDLPRPMTTVPGLAPPPIPVPPGLAPPPVPPLPPLPGGTSTLLGISTRRPPSSPPPMRVPNIRPPSALVPVIPPPKPPPPRPLTQSDPDPDIVEMDADSPPTLVPTMPGTPPELDFETQTKEMRAGFAARLGEASRRPTGEILPVAKEVVAAEMARKAGSSSVPIPVRPGTPPLPIPAAAAPGNVPRSSATIPGVANPPSPPPPPRRPSTEVVVPLTTPAPPTTSQWIEPPTPKLAPSHRGMWIVAAVVLLAGLGFGGWQLWRTFGYEEPPVVAAIDAGRPVARPDATRVAVIAIDAGAADPRADAAMPVRDAASVVAVKDAHDTVAVAQVDAARVAAVADAAVAPSDAAAPIAVASGDALAIDSTPHGARLFLDGADQGLTPAKLGGTRDRHTIALLLAGHELYIAKIDGHGTFTVPLKEVTPSGGPAGIKVVKCKDKDRFYVTVDGKPTGMTCPTERIECSVGPHTVEVYDVISETTKKWDINVTDTRLSYRVKIE